MLKPILVRGAKQLLTLRGPNGVRRGSALCDVGAIENGAVLIQDGVIAAVGNSRRIENLKESRNAIEIPANRNIVMPAFVDASINLGVDSNSGYAQLSSKRKNGSEFHEQTLSLLHSCLQHGTLTAEVKATVDGPDLTSRLALLRQLAKISNSPIRIVRTCRISLDADDDASLGLPETLAALLRSKLVEYVELDAGAEGKPGCAAFGTPEQPNLHLKLLWPGGSADRLRDLLSCFRPLSVCCPGQLSSEQSLVLSKASSIVVFSPGQEVFEATNPTWARDVVDGRGAIALSSGYDVTYAPTFSMQMAMALAVIRLRLTPEEAIVAATINAAYATGRGNSVGSLEVGKQADLLVLNVPDYRQIHRQFGINNVAMVIRAGQVVVGRTKVGNA